MGYQMTMKRPAAWWRNQWREGLPLGNGMTGALVYGGAVYERITLTHTFCWREGRQPELPDVSDCLPKMRELIEAGRMPEADQMLKNALLERGYDPEDGTPVPIADLLVHTPVDEGFKHYSRMLDMEKAEAHVRYEDAGVHYARRCFVSREHDLIALEISADGSLERTNVRLDVHVDDENSNLHKTLVHDVRYEELGEGCMGYSAAVDGRPFGAVMRMERSENRILALVKVFPDGNPEEKWQIIKQELCALSMDYDQLMAGHEPLHRELFERCLFRVEDDRFDSTADNHTLLDAAYEDGECPNALTERMWAYGRYLLICSSTPGGYPCPLMGLWTAQYRAGWAFNMANINLEMIYWLAAGGNLNELMLQIFDYYDGMMDGLRENARKLYGCRGIYLPAVSAPGKGQITCMASHIINWTGGAAWVSQHYYDYWLHTKDEEFLKRRLYPFLRETALFYSDFVVWKGDKWHVMPSVSPENHSGGYRGGPEVPEWMQTSIDATMDIALIREVMTNLLRIAPLCGAPQEEIDEWQRILDGSPEYQVGEDGGVREWNHPDYPDRNHHRHQSHIYPMFPGRERARKDPEPFIKGIHTRLRIGLDSQSSWSMMNMSCCFARAREGDMALRCLSLTARSMLMENLFTVHNDWRSMGISLNEMWAPFQIDANMGWTAAVQEMLLYSDEEYLEVYPAMPDAWRKGSITNMLSRCGVQVSLEWTEAGKKASLTALRDTEFTLCAGNEERCVSMKQGEEMELCL